MSVGINILEEALKSLKPLKGWTFEISETHHIHKKDKPSGTALFLQERLAKIVGPKNLLPTRSYRIGEAIGTHKVTAESADEVLRFEHEALSRVIFARGALLAAKWLIKRKRKPGLYDMSHVLFGP
jgi:4-hydroxy-tetrahydrodipicolinate reductase